MTTRHTFRSFDPNAGKKFILQGYDHYVTVFCDSINKKIHAFFEDPKEDYKLYTQTELGKTLFFHTVYKKTAVWVRAERPSLGDEFIINFFATKKPIGTYSSEVPTAVRFENVNYYDDCKHYATCCPSQPVANVLKFSFNGALFRAHLIHDWRFYDNRGWQGTLGDPEKIYPEEDYPGYP